MLACAALVLLPLAFAPFTTISLILFEATQTTVYWAAFALLCILFAAVASRMLRQHACGSVAERIVTLTVVLSLAGSMLIAPLFSEHESALSPPDIFSQWYLLVLWCLVNISVSGIVLLYAISGKWHARRILLIACIAGLQITAIGSSLP